MRTCLIASFILMTAAAAVAGTSVVMTGTASRLVPGAHWHLEAKAQYTLNEQSTGPADGVMRPVRPETVRYSVRAPQTLTWDFMVPPSGTVVMKPFTFQFGETLQPAPKGHTANLTLPVILYRADIPSKAPHVPSPLHVLHVDAELNTVSACIRIDGGANGTLTVAVVEKCLPPQPGGNGRR